MENDMKHKVAELVATLNQENQKARGLSMETWKRVVKAIEHSIPLYDQVNDLISLGRAQTARSLAVQELGLSDGMCLLDGGIGPGTTSRLILSAIKPGLLVGLDGSIRQLRTAKENLARFQNDNLEMVRASFEALPFREEAFDAIITSFALRDSLDISKSITEYSRVCGPKGSFADVDIGKPENGLKRAGSTVYLRYIMPLVAKVAILGKMKGNPWRMIVPTYKSLPTNRELMRAARRNFARVEVKEFLMGGVVVMIGRKSSG
jgi:demethylmenaquinone methyltransferase/2-methoxy-6-polyprenyl-1,4-benzoquinol methylase